MRGQNAPSSNIFILCTLLYSMVYFRVECVVNHDTFMYGVVCPKTGTTLKDGVAIYHPLGNMSFTKGFSKADPLYSERWMLCRIFPKGCSNFAPLYLVRMLHPRSQLVCHEMRRTPHGANHSSLITVPNKGMPRNRASLF